MTYTGEEVDGLLTRFEKAAEKQMANKASPVKLVAAERDLLKVAEASRDLLIKAAKGDKELLKAVFASHEDDRFWRFQSVLTAVELSDMHAKDQRWKQLQDAIETVQEILKQLGLFKPRGVVKAPTSLRYDGVPEHLAPGADVSLEAQVEGCDKVNLGFEVVPALPQGLLLNAFTGEIWGLPPLGTSCISKKYKVTVSNQAGSANAVVEFAVQAPAPERLEVSAPPECYVGETVSWVPKAVGGGLPLAWQIEPELPNGLTFNELTGAISGRLTSSCPSATYTLTASNDGGKASVNFTLSVLVPPPVSLAYSDAHDMPVNCVVYLAPELEMKRSVKADIAKAAKWGKVFGASGTGMGTKWGKARSAVLLGRFLAGGVAQKLDWSVEPPLPEGLALSAKTGVISGTPGAAVGKRAYTVTVRNEQGEASATLTFAVKVMPPQDLKYPTAPKTLFSDEPVTITPEVVGIVREWTIEPALPAGLSLDAAMGTICGTPTELVTTPGEWVVTGTNDEGSATATLKFAVKRPAPKELSYHPLAMSYAVLQPVNICPMVQGKVTKYGVNPPLPDGLQLDEATGVISGMARRIADVAQYTVTAENDSGKCSTTMAFAIKVMPPEALLYPGVDDAYNVGEGVYLEPMVLGGPTSWSVDPPLPQGFELDRSHGVITGAGEAPVPETSYTVTASNETGGTSVVLTFKVGTIGLAELQYPGVSSEFHVTQAVKLDPKLGSGTAEKFTIEPELPQGLQLDAATGVISGRPQCPVESKQYKVTAWSGGDKTEVTFTFACSDIERVKPKTWGCDPAYARMIEEITDIADMPPQPSRQEREFDWMVWMVHCVWLNDPMLKTLNFSGLKMPLPHEEPRVAPKLMKALAHNTNLASLQLADSNLRAQQGHELAESLRQNKTLKELNVESNKLDCESVQVLAGALKETQDSVLEIWRLANQHDIGDNLGTNVEKSLAEMLEKNMRIVKLGVSLQNPHWNQMITKYLTRNSDEARRRRKQAAGGGAAAPATLVEKPFAALVVMAPPNDKAAWEVFEEPEDGLLSVVRELMANKVKMPSREQLQAFAKGKGKPMPFSAVAPLLKKFQSLLLDSVVNCQVCARAEATGGQRTEGVLKAWSEKNDRWSVEVWTKEGSRYRFNSQKQPVIEPSPEVAAWLRPPEA